MMGLSDYSPISTFTFNFNEFIFIIYSRYLKTKIYSLTSEGNQTNSSFKYKTLSFLVVFVMNSSKW